MVELQVHQFLSTSQLWTWPFIFTFSIEKTDVSWWIKRGLETMPRYTYNNKRKNFTISCIQIGFNASKDIQEWMATVNLNLLTQKPIYLLSSYPYTGLTRLWKQTDRQTENLQNKNKTMAALLLVLEIYKKLFVLFTESEVLNLGVLHHNEKIK